MWQVIWYIDLDGFYFKRKNYFIKLHDRSLFILFAFSPLPERVMDEFCNYFVSLRIIKKIEMLRVNALPKTFKTACYFASTATVVVGVLSEMRWGSNETWSATSHNVSSFLFTGLRSEFNARLALTDVLDRGKGNRGKGRGIEKKP